MDKFFKTSSFRPPHFDRLSATPASPKSDNENIESAFRLWRFGVSYLGAPKGVLREGVRRAVGVLPVADHIPIYFNNQHRLVTVEIDDKSRNDLLPPKVDFLSQT